MGRCLRVVAANANLVAKVEEVDALVIGKRAFGGVARLHDVVLVDTAHEIAARLCAEVEKPTPHGDPKYSFSRDVMHARSVI